MANEDYLAVLRQGPKAWNQWRRENGDITPDLREANLSGADLGEADLCGAYLSQADLSQADLSQADLSRADLSRADLRKTHLSGANLSRADLSRADLGEAYLIGAYLGEADLIEANLSRADLRWAHLGGTYLQETLLADLDLSNTKELEACHHLGPSILDHRTLQRSGPLPEVFLRGCGLPDLLIDYLPSLFNQPIQYYSCFISYSSKDDDFAKRLHADLQAKGVRCWFAPHDMRSGKRSHEQIDTAIRCYDKLLLILSTHSINSNWVGTEIEKAWNRQVREKRQMLFPVRLVEDDRTLLDWEHFDADIGKDLAKEIRMLHIPNFSNWKDHDAYQPKFEQLLQDLKRELEKPPRPEGS